VGDTTAAAKAEKKHRGSKAKRWKRKAKGQGKKACTAESCKRAYRAKGYCYFHYSKWRRGELGHARYKTCNAPDCKKPQQKGGLCEQHHGEALKKAGAAA
jgi:hypothetical protein